MFIKMKIQYKTPIKLRDFNTPKFGHLKRFKKRLNKIKLLKKHCSNYDFVCLNEDK